MIVLANFRALKMKYINYIKIYLLWSIIDKSIQIPFKVNYLKSHFMRGKWVLEVLEIDPGRIKRIRSPCTVLLRIILHLVLAAALLLWLSLNSPYLATQPPFLSPGISCSCDGSWQGSSADLWLRLRIWRLDP